MNLTPRIDRRTSVCPHDCPSACSLDVEVVDGRTIGRVRGAEDEHLHGGRHLREGGALCRAHPPPGPTAPSPEAHRARRAPAGSSGYPGTRRWTSFPESSSKRSAATAPRPSGPTSMRAPWASSCATASTGCGTSRSTPASTRPSAPTWPGPASSPAPASSMGPDPREMAVSDCVVIWGTNPVHTQVNVMTHAMRARKERGAKIVAIDIYRNATMKQADMPLLVRPGTDGALACAVMHVLFRDGHADRDYLERYTDCPRELEEHLRSRDPSWASAITGLAPRGDRGFRGARRHDEAHLLSPRLRVRAPAQRHRRHACRELHRGGDGGVGARGRRRVPQQRRHLPFRQDPDRGSRCARSRGTAARPVADRPGAHRRSGRRSVTVRPSRR